MAYGFLVWSGKDSGNASFCENGGGFLDGNLDVFLRCCWWVFDGGGFGLWVWLGTGDFVEALVLKKWEFLLWV